MRKLIGISMVAMFALSGVSGAIFAQDTQTETAPNVTSAETRAWLGIAVVEEDAQVIVARVQPESPASAAELLEGDVIVAFDGTDIATASELGELVQSAAPGDTATLDLLRDGEEVSTDITLGSAPERGFGRGFGP